MLKKPLSVVRTTTRATESLNRVKSQRARADRNHRKRTRKLEPDPHKQRAGVLKRTRGTKPLNPRNAWDLEQLTLSPPHAGTSGPGKHQRQINLILDASASDPTLPRQARSAGLGQRAVA